MSSQMIYSMAPPAKASRNGRIAALRDTVANPSSVPAISITPVDMASSSVRRGGMPACSMGAISTMPSGRFCRAMPPAMASARGMSSVPKPTPAARPSGRLWMAMAATNSSTRSRWGERSAGARGSRPESCCIRAASRSSSSRNAAPHRIPVEVMRTAQVPPLSSDGRIRPATAALSMMPAAKDSTALPPARWATPRKQ